MAQHPSHDKLHTTRPVDEEAIWRARDVVESAFAEKFEPVNASADDLVTVWLDGGCRITRVMIHDGVGLTPEARERLEAALVSAARTAADRVANVHTERVTAALKERKLI